MSELNAFCCLMNLTSRLNGSTNKACAAGGKRAGVDQVPVGRKALDAEY
jgi:hypothetical protein